MVGKSTPDIDSRLDGPNVLPLAACSRDHADLVGGKAIGLGELLAHRLPVPAGFVVTTSAYHRALTASGLIPKIETQLAQATDLASDAAASRAIRSLFDGMALDPEAMSAIDTAYLALGDNPLVAVRSSATAEDTAQASFAGQQETYLGIRGTEAVRRHVIRCWSSLFTPHAIAYRREFAIPSKNLAMGVVVQCMVPATAAGVLMTLEPVTGDDSRIFLEATCGLGEGVVRGDVEVDRFWVLKSNIEVDRSEIGAKRAAYQMDPETGAVEARTLAPEVGDQPCLSQEEVIKVAALGRQVEAAFGCPMDVEWAIAPGRHNGTRNLFLLQARPETVWSSRQDITHVESLEPVWWDPLHSKAAPHEIFSRGNVAEAIPGVQSPLSCSLWLSVGDVSIHRAFRELGVFPNGKTATGSQSDSRFFRPFYGRAALLVQFLADVGDRMPGTTGEAVVRGILGTVPEGMAFAPTRRRYPIIAGRLPAAFATTPRRARRLARDIERWHPAALTAVSGLSLTEARIALGQARDRFEAAMHMQVRATFAVVQPLFDILTRIVDRAGVGDIGTLSGTGGPEMQIVVDLWRCAQGDIGLEAVTRLHGFHGPAEGLLESQVWREDDEPLRRLVALYTDRPDPRQAHGDLHLRKMQREVIATFPRWQRPAVAAALRLAASNILLRGVCKRAFLQCLDVCRATARHLGSLLADTGVLADPDDVFMLTLDDLLQPQLTDVRNLVAQRRQRWLKYQTIELPIAWQGAPQPLATTPDAVRAADGEVISGIGVSAGVVEGTVRVVHDPTFTDVGPDEVLVAPFTDPSWSSVLFVSSALVVDIGGALSHAAVVAREMNIPCVVGTRDGTQRLHTGDRVRVDGASGEVVVLARAQPPTAAQPAAF